MDREPKTFALGLEEEGCGGKNGKEGTTAVSTVLASFSFSKILFMNKNLNP